MTLKAGMGAHAFNRTTQEANLVYLGEFKASLVIHTESLASWGSTETMTLKQRDKQAKERE